MVDKDIRQNISFMGMTLRDIGLHSFNLLVLGDDIWGSKSVAIYKGIFFFAKRDSYIK